MCCTDVHTHDQGGMVACIRSAPPCAQVAQEQRANRGAITAAVRGPARPAGAAIHAAEALSRLFRAALDEVERNHATQARARGALLALPAPTPARAAPALLHTKSLPATTPHTSAGCCAHLCNASCNACAQVLVPSYWQRLLRLPPPAASSGAATLLAHDLHLGFGGLLFFGQELRLFVYEALLFSALFMQTGSAAAAGLVTFLVQRALAAARQHWGTHNLSRKTLVDRHFLI